MDNFDEYSNFTNSNVKFLREHNNIPQFKLAEDLQIDQSTIAKWENNTRLITLGWAFKLSNYFNVPIGDFLSKDLRLEKNLDKLVKIYEALPLLEDNEWDTIEFILNKAISKKEKK